MQLLIDSDFSLVRVEVFYEYFVPIGKMLRLPFQHKYLK